MDIDGMDDSGFQTTRPGYEAQGLRSGYRPKKANAERLRVFGRWVEEQKLLSPPLNQTWDWHQDKEATGGGVKISFLYPQNFLMTFS